jgi:uncharacterized protein YigA (DUF484 family)
VTARDWLHEWLHSRIDTKALARANRSDQGFCGYAADNERRARAAERRREQAVRVAAWVLLDEESEIAVLHLHNTSDGPVWDILAAVGHVWNERFDMQGGELRFFLPRRQVPNSFGAPSLDPGNE